MLITCFYPLKTCFFFFVLPLLKIENIFSQKCKVKNGQKGYLCKGVS